MGKTKRKKLNAKKTDPTPLPSVKDISTEDQVVESEEDTLLQSILDQLQSSQVESKESGCINLSLAIEHNSSSVLPLISQYDIVRVVAPLVVDPSVVVGHAAAGALRNLSAAGHEVCDMMIEQDVMTPLIVLLKERYQGWIPSDKKKETDKIDSKLEILVEAMNLLWNLCESNEKALSIFNREELLPIVIQFVNPVIYGSNLAIAAAHCLHTVSEDNSKAIELLNQPSLSLPIETLISLPGDGDFTTILLRSLAAGILFNTYHGKLSGCPVNTLTVIMQVISQTLTHDCSRLVADFLKEEKTLKNDSLADEVIRPNLEKENLVVEQGQNIENIISAQVIVLEMLTNVCCSDGGDDWDDLDSSDASDEMFNCDDVEMCDSIEKFPLSVAAEIHEAVVSHGFIAKVLSKIFQFPTEVEKPLKGKNQVLIKRLIVLQCRALLCLHNLISCLDCDDVGGSEALSSTWTALAQLTFKHTPLCPCDEEKSFYCETPEHVQLLEASTSALRAYLQKMAQAKCIDLNRIGSEELGLFSKLADVCSDSSVRINIINIMGTAGQVFAQLSTDNTQLLALVKDIGQFLIDISTKELPDLIVNAEAVDAIFDVFGDDDMDQLAREINLVERLKHMLPVLKHKLRVQRNILGDHYPVIVTAKTNLIRFIKYKSERLSANGHQ